MQEAGITVLNIHSSTTVIWRRAGCISSYNAKPVQNRAAVHITADYDMIRIISAITRSTDVAAQDGKVRFIISLCTFSLHAREAAIYCYTIFECEGNRAICGRSWLVGSCGDPDLIASRCKSGQCILQVTRI